MYFLAEAWVTFALCFLDMSAEPWRFKPHPSGEAFYIRPSAVSIIRRPSGVRGVACVQIGTKTGNTVYVRGTVEEVKAKLTGRSNQ